MVKLHLFTLYLLSIQLLTVITTQLSTLHTVQLITILTTSVVNNFSALTTLIIAIHICIVCVKVGRYSVSH